MPFKVCPNCGKDVRLTDRQCWNCHSKESIPWLVRQPDENRAAPPSPTRDTPPAADRFECLGSDGMLKVFTKPEQEIVSRLRKAGLLSSFGPGSPVTNEESDKLLSACMSDRQFEGDKAGSVLFATMCAEGVNLADRTSILMHMCDVGAFSAEVIAIALKVLAPQLPTYVSFTDGRDGQEYRTITIGRQVWMAENLKYEPSNKTRKILGFISVTDVEFLCNKPISVYQALIEGGSSGFNALLAGDYFPTERRFFDIGNIACFWSSTSLGAREAWCAQCASKPRTATMSSLNCYIDIGKSVRCIKD